MSGIDDIKNIIAKIDINKDGKISKSELTQAENKVPSVWLEKIKNLAQDKDISSENIIKGFAVESNPQNKPITAFHDKRPDFEQKDWSDNLEKVYTKQEFQENITDKGIYDLSLQMTEPLNADLDFSDALWLLQSSSFGSKTFANTPKEHLPEGYDPQKVIELGKNPGLNTRAVHEMGYTGKGVKVAIMDWQLPLSDNYDSNITSYRAQDNAKIVPETMHGAAVTSILAGKETGVIPDAEVYYFAEQSVNSPKNDDLIKSFKNVLELNKNLPENEKIRVISLSGPLYGGEEAEKLAQQLNESGVWVMSSPEFWENFGYLDKKDPMGNPDDFDNYNIHNLATEGAKLYVNSGNRTVSHYSKADDFRHDSKASASWAIPIAAGYYALACEADPSMTKEKFLKLAEETAQIRELELPKPANPQGDYERHEGFVALMLEEIRKDHPDFTYEDYENMDEETFNSYNNKMFEQINTNSAEDFELLCKRKGMEVLQAKGAYDEYGNIKEIPERYLPKTEITQAKIIDIKALIERIETQKNKD